MPNKTLDELFAENFSEQELAEIEKRAAVMLSDNFLKPMLMGRGASVPVLVIFMGAIGGFMLEGIIGLFTGAVVLALGYTLFRAWRERVDAQGEPAGT